MPDGKQSGVLATPPDRVRKAEAGPGSRAEGLKEEEPAPFHNGALARGTPDGTMLGAEHHRGSHLITAHLNIEGAVHT